METPYVALNNHDDWINLVLAKRAAEELGVGALCRQIAQRKTILPDVEQFAQAWGGLVPHAIY